MCWFSRRMRAVHTEVTEKHFPISPTVTTALVQRHSTGFYSLKGIVHFEIKIWSSVDGELQMNETDTWSARIEIQCMTASGSA